MPTSRKLDRLLKTTSGFYGPAYAPQQVAALESSGYSPLRYLWRFWTSGYDGAAAASQPASRTVRNRALFLFITLGSLLQVLTGVVLLSYNLWHDTAGALPFGLALVISYPIVWAHLLALGYGGYKAVWSVVNPKIAGKNFVCRVLEWQVVRLRQKHNFKLIAVAGSIGKTSTKLAIAHTLEPSRRVIYQTGNYNDRVTVPLVLFGEKLPNLLDAVAWARIFVRNEQAISRPSFYDCAVLELGTDHPGQMAMFAYLQPDITVVTAVTPEHMEYFGSLDAVAAEELVVTTYSKQTVINNDDTPAKYLGHQNVLTYGTKAAADFKASAYKPDGLRGGTVKLSLQNGVAFREQAHILGEQGVKILLAAAAVGQLAGLNEAELKRGLSEVKPFAGRMQVLAGIKGSTIIDDTYNASPVAVMAALDVLYAAKAMQRIVILGNMNELGNYSPQAHTEVGAYCRADKLDLVVTIGADAETYLAPAAASNGCETKSFTSPYDAGAFVAVRLKKGAVILAEGSQNQVFAEESLKVLLAEPADAKKLVRQSADGICIKLAQFKTAEVQRSIH